MKYNYWLGVYSALKKAYDFDSFVRDAETAWGANECSIPMYYLNTYGMPNSGKAVETKRANGIE